MAGLLPDSYSARRWFAGKGRAVAGFALDDAVELNERSWLAVIEARYDDGPLERYLVPIVADPPAGGSAGIREAKPGDDVWRDLASLIATGDVRRTLTGGALICRPAAGLVDLVNRPADVATLGERALGADQSNTSVVLGERLLLKAFRRLVPGLNPDLELNAYLAEEVAAPFVPALAGWAELIGPDGTATTVAMLSEYLVDAADAYEALAEEIADWLLAPGEVTVEFATEEAVRLGTMAAALHATLLAADGLPGFETRAATAQDLRHWRLSAEARLDAAIATLDGLADTTLAGELKARAPAIRERFAAFESPALDANPPVLARIHADLHLGQVLVDTDGGLRIVDFEGDPLRSMDDRREPASPLRDVASMLRSLDHVGRSASRRAQRRHGGPLERTGLDLDAWLLRVRERFLAAYLTGLVSAGAQITVNAGLLRAFELEKECAEFVYAATYLPSWLWAPREGMRALVELPLDVTKTRRGR